MGYVPVPEGIKNTSGRKPTWIRALVLPDKVDEKAGEAGLIIKPTMVKDKEEMVQIDGTLIAVGGNAFDGMAPPIPQVGDRVSFAKYAGFYFEGKDRQEYRMINGRDIFAILED